jgi:hypothetical protein
MHGFDELNKSKERKALVEEEVLKQESQRRKLVDDKKRSK